VRGWTPPVWPAIPRPGKSATLTVTGASEAPMQAYAKIRAAGGAPCAPTYNADSGDSLLDGTDVNGAFSLTADVTRGDPGSYLICLWLASSSDDPAPIAGPQPDLRRRPATAREAVVGTGRS
jgi:hypothetical protein